MNPKAETVEDLLARRKNLHMGMLKLAREDLALKLQAALDVFVVLALSFTAKQQFEHGCIESCCSLCNVQGHVLRFLAFIFKISR